MPETPTAPEAGQQSEQSPQSDAPKPEGFAPITSQEELDRIIQKRVARVESKFSDYADLRTRAQLASDLESKASELEAKNTELTQRVEAFEATEARGALVRKVAEGVGLDAEIIADLRADTEEELTAAATKLRDRMKPTAPHIPGQETFPENTPRDVGRDTVKQLFG